MAKDPVGDTLRNLFGGNKDKDEDDNKDNKDTNKEERGGNDPLGDAVAGLFGGNKKKDASDEHKIKGEWEAPAQEPAYVAPSPSEAAASPAQGSTIPEPAGNPVPFQDSLADAANQTPETSAPAGWEVAPYPSQSAPSQETPSQASQGWEVAPYPGQGTPAQEATQQPEPAAAQETIQAAPDTQERYEPAEQTPTYAAPEPDYNQSQNQEPAPSFGGSLGGGLGSAVGEAVQNFQETRRTYTVNPGDNLSSIAQQMYGDGNQWQRIFDANRDLISNPDLIYPGQQLQIP